MKALRFLFRWCVGILLGVYILLLAALNLPPAQRWVAAKTGNLLSDWLQARVEIDRVQVGWNMRLIVDGLSLDDRSHRPLLRVSRVAAKLDLWELARYERVCIGNGQLFGLHAHICQERPDSALNVQFLIDAFSNPNSDKSSHLDLQIGQLVIRRGHVSFDRLWKPEADGFSVDHIAVSDLNLTAGLHALTQDSVNAVVRRLDLRERSGLKVENLTFDLRAGRQSAVLSNFLLRLPHSELSVSEARLKPRLQERSFSALAASLRGTIDLADLKPLLPGGELKLPAFADLVPRAPLHLAAQLKGEPDNVEVNGLHLWTADKTFGLFGWVNYAEGCVKGDLRTTCTLGSLVAEGSVDVKDKRIDLRAKTDGLRLASLLSGKAAQRLGTVVAEAEVKGRVPDQLDFRLTAPSVEYGGHNFCQLAANGSLRGKLIDCEVASGDPLVNLQTHMRADLAAGAASVVADVYSFKPHALHLTQKFADTGFSGRLKADIHTSDSWQPFSWAVLDRLAGYVHVDDFCMTAPDTIYCPGDLHITSLPDEGGKRLRMVSPFLEAQVNGDFEYAALPSIFLQTAASCMPSLTELAEQQSDTTAYANFDLRLYSAEPFRQLLGIPLYISSPISASGTLDAGTHTMQLALTAPEVGYGKELLRQVDLRVESNLRSLQANLQLQRRMKKGYVQLGIDAHSAADRLATRFYWNNQRNPSMLGDVGMVAEFSRDSDGKPVVEAEVQASNFVMADTLWEVHPATLTYRKGRLEVESLMISSGDRYLAIDGTASAEPTDTLHAALREINLDYVFSMVNFNAVEFSGKATGHAFAHSLFSKPYADAYLQIPHFALNHGELGDLTIYGNWGKRPYSIFLDGVINTPLYSGTLVSGYITPKKDVDYHGIDLMIQADHANLFFLNKFTSGIFDDLQGHASGWARIYGPFRGIELEGRVLVDEASVGIPFTGVRYHVENDSVWLDPGVIRFANATVCDPQGSRVALGEEDEESAPGTPLPHTALATGWLTHSHFSNLCYDITLLGNNILGYDFKEFGDMPFYATVFASGNVRLHGKPGECNIDIKATPQPGSSGTYNGTSPDKLTESQFLTFVDRQADCLKQAAAQQTATGVALSAPPASSVQPASDLRINFDLDVTPDIQLSLLTDAKAGDRISVNGHGHMLASYYNKGDFQLYGTYHVERGNYNLSIQEVIRKNFELQPGGTVTLAGDPMEGNINVQAVHTVSGVSLNDISPRANFSNSRARVNCLMNVTGKVSDPHIAFDFDIPNVNEDEKQMVRSLISTEEERNMQVVYLLGIGRFYTYEYNNDAQSQGYTAMNSLLSSTLSTQINQMLTNMLGSHTWNFGTNLRTGEMGWNDMDVEGVLQGSLLNNRLLINGQFGYRDNPAMQNNFVGDFDARYLLTRSGGVSLKAYSETNDRYFTKSALTTQGIGLLLRRDFTSWKDFFYRQRRLGSMKAVGK